MKLFRRDINQPKLSEKAAAGIANGILKFQNWFTEKMQSLTKNWEQKERWIFLYIVCLVFGGLSIVAIIHPFRSTAIKENILPKPISSTMNVEIKGRGFLITKEEFLKVQEYKLQHPDLMRKMPGLYDSLNLIEQMYYSQQK